MSSKVLKAEDVERIKSKVNKMYENYGIVVDGLDEGDVARVYRYYIDKEEELNADHQKSKKYIGSFDDDDII